MKRNYIIPLRSSFGKKPKYKRTPTAVRAVKKFLIKHMKVEKVKLGKNLNLALWANGIKNPPPKISVEVEKKENTAYVELSGKNYNEPTKEDLEKIKEASKKKKKEVKKEVKKEIVEDKLDDVSKNLEMKKSLKEEVKKEVKVKNSEKVIKK